MPPAANRPLKALVYRGPAACDGCPESVADLLESSPSKIEVTYAGPDEDTKLTAEALSNVDIYAHPGGGDMDDAWKHMKGYKANIRNFVEQGGRYMGFCLGAYLAGHSPGFDLLDKKDDTDAECDEPGAQIDDEREAVIQVDWTFSTGPGRGSTDLNRWLYFQDGAVIELSKKSSATVLGRYSATQDVAASLSTFGKGWVGLVGPHPEAGQDWYDRQNFKNPDGIRFDIGHDFVETVAHAGEQDE
ncbi:hypothetical protein DOTSEDRAFT_178749 [Dothistroma septosporum NZE10]|uniref:Biotin-protein ligase N-terminal domain-containing protein n=1 Tax=Dothistroma septosporum (strain NZE10 / CBS 128990) TaxID=675120 RepID=N1PBZ9_DOTSN|nr:hypothetical protein DOTSEDRAFT_178749 [Dothistroma septosporum NZE10]